VDIPEPGRLRIFDAPFSFDPTGETARSFLERAFSSPDVERVSIDGSDGVTEIRYRINGVGSGQQIVALSRLIAGRATAPRAVKLPESFGKGVDSRVRLQSYGDHISSWSVRHEIPGRIRFENPILVRRRALRQTLEAELVNAFGIDKFSVQELTGTVLIHYNPRQIRKRQIVALLDAAIDMTEDFSLAPIDYDLPVSLASMGLSAVSAFFLPALTPLSAALFLYSTIPSFKGAYNVLVKERRLGVDVLDAIVVAACLVTNHILAGSILSVSLAVSRKLV